VTEKAARRATFSSAQCQKRLLAQVLFAVCAAERGARRTGKVVVSCVGLPIAPAIAVPVIVVVIEGTERGSRYRACRCDGAADDGARRADRPHRPAILIFPGQSSVGVAKPFATIGHVTLHVALAFGEGLRPLDLAIAAYAVGLFVFRTLGHGALGHRRARQRGGEDGGGAEDRKTQFRHGTLPFL